MVGVGSQVLGARPQSWLRCQARYPGPGGHKSCPNPGTVVQGGYLVRGVESESPKVLQKEFLTLFQNKDRTVPSA